MAMPHLVCAQRCHECIWNMLNCEVVGVLTDHKDYVKLQLVRQVEQFYISVAGIDQVAYFVACNHLRDVVDGM